jgi:multimeric flavodoxin WrbA
MPFDAVVAVVYASRFGHTARQAAAVHRGAASVPAVRAVLLEASSLDEAGWAELDAADAIVFGAPTYMGAPSSEFQAFAERTSAAWGDGLRWKDKLAAGFTNSQNVHGDKDQTLHRLAVLAAQHGMQWVSLGLYPGWNTTAGGPGDLNRLGSFLGAMAQSYGDLDAESAPPEADLLTAEHLGRRVAGLAVTWAAARSSGRERRAA